MLKEYRKQVFTAFVIVLFLFTLSLGLIALYFTHLETTNLNQVNAQLDSLQVRFRSNDDFTISSVLPLSDALGKKISNRDVLDGIQKLLDFEIKNVSSKEATYEVFLTKQYSSTSSIPDNYIKLYLTDYNDVPFEKFNKNEILTYGDLSSIIDKPESKLLYTGNIYGKANQKLRLRVWLSDSYLVSNTKEDITINVGVREKRENQKYGY